MPRVNRQVPECAIPRQAVRRSLRTAASQTAVSVRRRSGRATGRRAPRSPPGLPGVRFRLAGGVLGRPPGGSTAPGSQPKGNAMRVKEALGTAAIEAVAGYLQGRGFKILDQCWTYP